MPGRDKKDFKKRSGRDWVSLILSLLLALFIWLVHNLSNDYSAYLRFQVKAVTNIEGHHPEAVADESLLIRGRATGFYIIRNNRRGSVPQITLEVPPELFTPVEEFSDRFVLTANDLKDKLSAALSGEINIDFVETSTLSFTFPEQSHRKVPVNPLISVVYKKQYINAGDIVISPDSVLIYGNTEDIANIRSVNTLPVNLSNVDKSIQGVTGLETIRDVRIDSDKIRYFIKVDRYVEVSDYLSVKVNNLPSGYSIVLIPSRVKFTGRIPFTAKNDDIFDDISLILDYNTFIRQKSSKVIPILDRGDVEIYSYSLDPPMIEAVITQER